MKKIMFLLGISLAMLSSNCENEEMPTPSSGTLALNFEGTYDGAPLTMFASVYDYEADMKLRLQLFQFYISNIELIESGDEPGTGLQVLDVDLVNFKNVQSEAAALEGIDINIEDIPVGSYDGIRFKLGVAPDLNDTAPGDYSTTHPLSNHYWSASQGYVFTKIEGNADIDGTDTYAQPLTFHVGTDVMLREISFNQPLEITEGAVTDMDFKVDLKKILVNAAGEFLDFRQTPVDHSSNVEVAGFLADNLVTAITVE